MIVIYLKSGCHENSLSVTSNVEQASRVSIIVKSEEYLTKVAGLLCTQLGRSED
jgi:hypothetical protein